MKQFVVVLFLTYSFLNVSCARPARFPVPQPATEPQDKPGEAIEYYMNNRRVPGGSLDLPMERYFQARERIRRMPLYSSALRQRLTGKSRDALIPQWQYLGPGNIGGRTRTLLIHPRNPKVLYTAGVAGGVWKSEDEGGSWKPLTDSMANLAVSTLAMDPANPDILYAGTGEGFSNIDAVTGAGIFQSLDGGETWNLLPQARFRFTNKIVISTAEPRHVYAATNTGVWRSRNRGAAWEQVLKRDATGQFGCQDLAIRTDSSNDVVFASCRANPQGAIFRNLDAGGDGEWKQVFTAEFMARTSLAIAPSRQDTIYAMAASSEPGTCPSPPGPRPIGACFRDGLLAVYRSTANGDEGSWEARARNSDENAQAPSLLSNPLRYFADVCSGGQKSFSSQGWYDNVIAVDPTDSERVWAGGIDLFRSGDGGRTWSAASFWFSSTARSYVHADQHFIAFHPAYDGATNRTMYVTNDGGVFRTRDATADAATGTRGPCSAANSAMVFEGLNNGYGVTQFYHGAVYPGGHIYFGGTQDNGTVRGNDGDGPDLWARIMGGDGGYVAVDPRDARLLYGTTTRLSLRRSVDGGASFSSAISGITEASSNFAFIAPFTMDPTNPERLWTGGRSMWVSSNSARTWERASPELTTASSINAIGISPADPNRIIVGTRDGFLYRTHTSLSLDTVAAWPSVRLRTGVVSWVAFDPLNPDVAYVTYSNFNALATDRHIYKTTDGGVTWSGLDGTGDTGIPDIPVHCILPDPVRPSTLYLGTDLGVFVSEDGGAAWSRENTGFPNTVVESLTLERTGTGAYLIAFTHGRGAWRVWLGPGDPCRYEVSPAEFNLARGAAQIRINVQTEEGCRWSGLSTVSWILPASEASGISPGSMVLNVAANNTNQNRQTRLLVAGQPVRVVQSAQ
jgi:photosystem II stability/assembly factor-like uncharacterized protein